MKKIIDHAIVLRRINYGEHDRVVNVLTKDHGKISLFAKGSRKQKSRLNSGIELLNINEVGYMAGKTSMKTLVSANLLASNHDIVRDINRTNLIFENLKLINKIIEDDHGQELFDLIKTYLTTMNDMNFNHFWIEIWFRLKLLQSLGLISDLATNNSDKDKYTFDWEEQIFIGDQNGSFVKNDIKFLRLLLSSIKPLKLQKLLGTEEDLLNFSKLLLENNIS